MTSRVFLCKPLAGADGVGLVKHRLFAGPTPPRPLEQWWLRDLLLDGAATPPRLRRGVRASEPFGNTPEGRGNIWAKESFAAPWLILISKSMSQVVSR